ncbi:MAG: type II secretion system secretin GspD [Bdellovibrionales bacterium]|nr:type II secretion system secretin GspD [Bdellovibrionales bacterium]
MNPIQNKYKNASSIHRVSFFVLLLLFGVFGNSSAYAKGMVSLDFHDVEIKDIVKSISEITGKNFIFDEKARGKVTIVSPNSVTVDEAYQAFISALEMKGLTTVQVGKNLKIVRSTDAKAEAIPVVADGNRDYGDQLITRVVPIKYIDANQIQTNLRRLYSRSGIMAAYGPTNSLIITDTGSNIRRLISIIEKLDQQGYQNSVEVIPLRYSQAQDVAEKITNLFQSKGSSSKTSRLSSNVERGDAISKVIPDIRTNSLIVTATREGLTQILDIVSELDKEIKDAMNQGRIHVRRLKHADAEELATLLGGLLSGSGSSSKSSSRSSSSSSSSSSKDSSSASSTKSSPTTFSGGGSSGVFEGEIRVAADPGTNALVITASPNDFLSLKPVIDQLDVRRPQVFVEALIMEVAMGKNLDVGVRAHGVAGNGLYGASQVGGSDVTSTNPLSALSGGLGLGFASFSKLIPGTKLPSQGVILKAMQTNNNVNVLSAPNILTTDNQKAEIKIGKKVSYVSSETTNAAGSPVRNWATTDVNLELHVTPQINDGNEVTMEIEQIIDDLIGTVDKIKENGVNTSSRKAKTTVIAQNQQTVVIGGLIKDKENQVKTKVPILGDIPIFGNLFKQKNTESEKVNLMVFITPHIIRDPKDMTRVSVMKNNQRRRFNRKYDVGENRAIYDYGMDKDLNMAPRQTEPDPQIRRVEYKKAAPQKRFNYLEEDTSGEDVAGSEQNRLRSGTESTQYSQGNSLRPRNSAPTSSNPFAQVRPPSSE